MTQHTITILQKNYNISCNEDEIPRLKECTDLVNELLQKTHKNSTVNSENTLMVMALLTIADELLDYKNNLVPAPIPQKEQIIKEIIKIETVEKTPDDVLSKLENLCQKMTTIDAGQGAEVVI